MNIYNMNESKSLKTNRNIFFLSLDHNTSIALYLTFLNPLLSTLLLNNNWLSLITRRIPISSSSVILMFFNISFKSCVEVVMMQHISRISIRKVIWYIWLVSWYNSVNSLFNNTMFIFTSIKFYISCNVYYFSSWKFRGFHVSGYIYNSFTI